MFGWRPERRGRTTVETKALSECTTAEKHKSLQFLRISQEFTSMEAVMSVFRAASMRKAFPAALADAVRQSEKSKRPRAREQV